MKITIHQPEHMPWLGLIDKISKADIFVILDTVQFEKNYFQNRNKIKTEKGSEWITVPIKKFKHNTPIKDIKISYNEKWENKYLNKIKQHYQKSNYFNEYFPVIRSIIKKKHPYLSELNTELIKQMMQWFEIETKIILSSELKLSPSKTGGLVNYDISKKMNAQIYLSGPTGKEYLDLTPFNKGKIKVEFHEFNHPEYNQQHKPFISNMSSIDLLFNYGPKAKEVLKLK